MIEIQTTYSKKLGLPNYSSHSFSVTVRAEVSSLRRIEAESARLYRLLQASVDKEIQGVGFLPDSTRYGMILDTQKPTNGSTVRPASRELTEDVDDDVWGCSDKQRAFIEKVAKREKFTPADLDAIAKTVCQLPVRKLDKREASKLIDELLNLSSPPRFSKRSNRPEAATNGAAA